MEAVTQGHGESRISSRIDEDRYRFLLENSGDILWTIDLNGRWQFMTRNVEKIVHMKLNDILEEKWSGTSWPPSTSRC